MAEVKAPSSLQPQKKIPAVGINYFSRLPLAIPDSRGRACSVRSDLVFFTTMKSRCFFRHLIFSPRLVAVPLLLASFLPHAQAADWPQWRGPQGNGVAPSGKYPTKFGEKENVLWKYDLPGKGTSTPAIAGDRLFMTSPIEGKDGVVCLNLKGKELWRKTLGPEGKGQREHRNGSTSNPSPVGDGTHIFAYFQSGRLASFTHAGEKQWEINLQEKYGKDTLWWPLGSSPVLTEKYVVVAVLHAGNSYLVACDKKTGNITWKSDRNYKTQTETDQAYTTPQLIDQDGRQVLVTWGADHLTAHDANSGKPVWSCGGFNPNDKAMWRVIASPALSDGIAAVPYGRTKFLAGVKLGGKGDITATHRLWERNGIGADCPSPVADKGRLYLLTDRGMIHCLDLKTGKDIWKEKLPRSSKSFFSSPVLAGDLLYCGREDGTLFCGKIGPEGFKLLHSATFEGGIVATPIPLDDKLYLRTTKSLYCFGD